MEPGINGIELKIGTAYGPVEPLHTKKKTAHSGDIETDGGRVPVIIKLLKMEDIVREAICWTLARSLGLPIPQAFLVQVDPSVVVGRWTGNLQHLAFGSEVVGRGFRHHGEEEMAALRNWRHAVACAVFDTWIHCTDRLPNNLLINVDEGIWLIDHEEALPNYAGFDVESNSGLFQILREDRSDSELLFMKSKALNFTERCRDVDLAELQELILGKFTRKLSGNSIEAHMKFLSNRAEILPKLIEREFNYSQKLFTLHDDVREEMERYE